MELKKCICPYCNELIVGRNNFLKHKKLVHNIKKGQVPKVLCSCSFCKRNFEYISSKKTHEKYCIQNPNAILAPKHKVSEKTKKKISEGMKMAHKEGRANEWQGRRYRSYAEQSWYNIFTNDLGKGTFINNFFVKKYWLDFAWPDKKIYFEVDGRTHFTEEGIQHDVERTEFLLEEGWTLIGRCNWSEYQKLSRIEKEKYVLNIEQKILTENPKG